MHALDDPKHSELAAAYCRKRKQNRVYYVIRRVPCPGWKELKKRLIKMASRRHRK